MHSLDAMRCCLADDASVTNSSATLDGSVNASMAVADEADDDRPARVEADV